MKIKSRIKNLFKRVTKIQFITTLIVIVVLVIAGILIFDQNGPSHAGSDNFQNLGSVNWNPNITAYFSNSKFYNYACVTQDPSTLGVTVSGQIIATSYVKYMKAGNYLPSVATKINGKVQAYGTNWQFGTLQGFNGAYITFKTALMPINATYQSGPLATNLWPSVWTPEYIVENLSTCNGLPLILPSQATTTLSSAMNVSTTQVEVSSTQYFPSSGEFYIQIGSEKMLVTAGQGTSDLTVIRGVKNTTISAHVVGSTVQEILE